MAEQRRLGANDATVDPLPAGVAPEEGAGRLIRHIAGAGRVAASVANAVTLRLRHGTPDQVLGTAAFLTDLEQAAPWAPAALDPGAVAAARTVDAMRRAGLDDARAVERARAMLASAETGPETGAATRPPPWTGARDAAVLPGLNQMVRPRGAAAMNEMAAPAPRPAGINQMVGPRADPAADEDADAFDRALALDLAQVVLDLAGILDPTPISDGTNAMISLGRGDVSGAVLSAISIVPWIGDLAKLGRLPKLLRVIEHAIALARRSPSHFFRRRRWFERTARGLDLIPENLIPPGLQSRFDQVRADLSRLRGDARALAVELAESFPRVDHGDPAVRRLLDDLSTRGVRHTPENIVAIRRTDEGRVVFLETGGERAGLAHVIHEHALEFIGAGISINRIPDAIMTAIMRGRVIGYQGRDLGRPIYEFDFLGRRNHVSITIGDNGFIVGANLLEEYDLRRILRR